ncbi:hypothetical protein [Streptomyces sp. Ag109_O5-1]|uniref:hypothetical protein n=1 Tax=Streptomyces sp. Ag109_O5-1 TaxID=1938851 RepID=UPI0021A566C2|nr:hypothetical protein [Streptomyces sp. Ag109_O5-1]
MTKRDGLMYTEVVVVATGNTIDFRVPHDSAPAIKSLLTDLVLGKVPAPGHTPPPPAQPSAPRQAAPSNNCSSSHNCETPAS